MAVRWNNFSIHNYIARIYLYSIALRLIDEYCSKYNNQFYEPGAYSMETSTEQLFEIQEGTNIFKLYFEEGQ